MHAQNLFGSWRRSDQEGRAKEEEVMSRKRKAEEEIERDSVGGKCACFNFGSVVRPKGGVGLMWCGGWKSS